MNRELNSGKPANLVGYAIDASSGALQELSTPRFTFPNMSGASTATNIAIMHPSGNFAYMSHGDGNTIDVFQIDRNTGVLSLVAGSPIETAINPSSVVFTPDGKYAYVTSTMNVNQDPNSAQLIAFSVNQDTGMLTRVATAPTADWPGALTVDPSSQFLYVSENQNYLRIYKIQADGTPKFVRKLQARPGLMSIAMPGADAPVQYRTKNVYTTEGWFVT